ncbi:hypothetical protein HELRODRAFT_160611 [Helobdella robusta]|uniref:Uncharacterized protein n=1 Tax=Helobdella robusta TaxID=6412 RepID=T1EQH7_HELRO|nr:hypothetical protein HELRODRAFT_160611 [Helobdella robusta]ESO06441.1 hypothetical protein HELRODRAFT_160611 [Helobdella robusta]
MAEDVGRWRRLLRTSRCFCFGCTSCSRKSFDEGIEPNTQQQQQPQHQKETFEEETMQTTTDHNDYKLPQPQLFSNHRSTDVLSKTETAQLGITAFLPTALK